MSRALQCSLFTMVLALALTGACNNESAAPAASSTNAPAEPAPPTAVPVAAAPTTAAAPAPKDDGLAHSGPVAYTLNGQPADVAPRAGDDSEQMGTWMRMNNYLTLNLYGDMPGAAKRAWVRVMLLDFEGKAGEYKVEVAITRYRDANGAGETSYRTRKEVPGTLNIETISEGEPSPLGKIWKASGRFSAELPLKPGDTSDLAALSLTHGIFTDLVIQEVGKPKAAP